METVINKRRKDSKKRTPQQRRKVKPVGPWPQVVEAHREKQENLTASELARRAGLTRVGYYYFVIGRSKPRVETVEMISEGLGVPFPELAREAHERRNRS